jgi:hypothetical protein
MITTCTAPPGIVDDGKVVETVQNTDVEGDTNMEER